MADTIVPPSPADNVKEYEVLADQLLEEMRLLNDRMQRDRTEIELLKAETRRLEAENREVLTRLEAMA